MISFQFLVGIVYSELGNVWHLPATTETQISSTMRDPLYEITAVDTLIYQGFFKNGGAGGNQTGGTLFYRTLPRGGTAGAWQSVALAFHQDVGNNQYWKATLPSVSLDVTDVIEYYLEVTFTDRETTYLFGADTTGSQTTDIEATAQASPFSIRNRPGWIYHGNNRILAGDDLQVRVKTGYIGPDNVPESRWANAGAIYYTTDGTEPAGSLGVASGTSMAQALEFDGTEGDNSLNGNAVWWRGTVSGLLSTMQLGDTVKYKIGLWNSETNEEKFADHAADLDNQTFSFQNGTIGEPVLTINGLSANYTTTKLFVDEIAGDSINLDVVFEPGESNVVAAEIYTNLNRRDRAELDADNDGYPDGISGLDGNSLNAGDDGHYYKAYTMTGEGPGRYVLTLPATKTGAYRLTARWKVDGDPAWRWYTNGSANRRDHAITVSPKDARNVVLYEINVLNIEASGDQFGQRSTIEDMHNASGAPHNANNRWDLDYVLNLGANWLWFQPIHPNGYDGREPTGGYGTSTPLYDPGSPYAVKNFFQVNPIMSKDFSGDPMNPTDTMNSSNRNAAMNAWQNFVTAADLKDLGIMLDAPFNHTAFDVELADVGVELFEPDGATWSATDEIRNREARFFSKVDNYDQRASGAGDIAPGPDRFDFGKWNDVKDVFFGVYAALVPNSSESGNYLNEGDWFDASDVTWTANDFIQNGEPVNVTRRVWEYFARYSVYWLEKTRPAGENRNSETEAGLTLSERYEWDARGIDGLRCDFGQGLPPQAWEYMINVARSKKWNFVMMSESLDGGAVTYRSNRHFDILNENIVFPLKSASTKYDYRNIFEQRRNAYGQGLVLTNTTSHDEENYSDPWEAVVRFGVTASLDGVPMIFPGQELGISQTFGYEHYETNFGKQIAHFKRYNSMSPIWNDTDFGNDQLYKVYSGMALARQISPALRSSNRWFLDGDGNNPSIHAVAKYETSLGSPATSDLVLVFTNLNRSGLSSDTFKIPAVLATQIGIEDTRLYNARNISAYLGSDPSRREEWVWPTAYSGSELKNNGIFVSLNPVPSTEAAWATAPFEAQYLKVYDVTAPSSAPTQPLHPRSFNYEIGEAVTFDWEDVAADAGGVVPHYEVTVTVNGGTPVTQVVTDSQVEISGSYGDEIQVSVKAVNPDAPSNAGPASLGSQTITLLDPDLDEDNDGQSNGNESKSGTNPLDSNSVFKVINPETSGASFLFTVNVVPGFSYTVQSNSDLSKPLDWVNEDEPNAVGYVPGEGETQLAYEDANPGPDPKFYRVVVSPVTP
ncbi:MAG: hypothetical protein ACO3N7_00460 [Kiritimatiellia bacterium]